MSLKGTMSIYEKMLQNPENRKSTSGTIKQPTPYDSGDIKSPGKQAQQTGEELNSEESAYLQEIDRRMALRSAGKEVPSTDDNRIKKLEEEVSELKELVMQVMKTHMKLLEKTK